MFTVLMEM